MKKKLRFYKQHSMETCGPACMPMDTPFGKIYIAVGQDMAKYPTQEV